MNPRTVVAAGGKAACHTTPAGGAMKSTEVR